MHASMTRGHQRSTCFLVLAAALAFLQLPAADAYAVYYHSRGVASSCLDHPTQQVGNHLTPVADSSITIAASTSSSGSPTATQLCPGTTYYLSTAYATLARSVLMTASQGTLTGAAAVSGCSNAITTSSTATVTSLQVQLALPCGATGNVQVRITAGKSSSGALQSASATFIVAAVSSCPSGQSGGTCYTPPSPTPGSSPSPSSNNSISTSPAPGGGSSTPSDPSTQGSSSSSGGSSQTGGSSTPQAGVPDPSAGSSGTAPAATNCTPSSLGYSCSQSVDAAVVIHYSYGGLQPSNPCTAGTQVDASLAAGGTMQHFAIESSLAGYASIGFTSSKGQMVPSDSVIGTAGGTAAPQALQYSMTGYSASGVSPSPAGSSWSTGLGAIRSGGKSVVCFSRPLVVPQAAAAQRRLLAPGLNMPQLTAAGLDLIWAAHSTNNLAEVHDRQGSLTLNMLSGQATGADGSSSSSLAGQIAHGLFMLIAFCYLMPVAAVVARHRWLLADPQTGRISPRALKWHEWAMKAAAGLSTIGFFLAIGLWWRRLGTGASIHTLYNPHAHIGIAVAVLALLQVLYSLLPRPAMGAFKRGLWNLLHSTLGWSIVLLGAIDCVLGAVLMHDLKQFSWASWLWPVLLPLALLWHAGLVLEGMKFKLEQSGEYSAQNMRCTPLQCNKPGSTGSAPAAGAAAEGATGVREGAVNCFVSITSRTASATGYNKFVTMSGHLSADAAAAAGALTQELVGQHCRDDSCWIIINNKVYDVSSYLHTHPGGEAILLSCGGTDATADFMASHSKKAKELLQQYFLGHLAPATMAAVGSSAMSAQQQQQQQQQQQLAPWAAQAGLEQAGSLSAPTGASFSHTVADNTGNSLAAAGRTKIISPLPPLPTHGSSSGDAGVALVPKGSITCKLLARQKVNHNCYMLRFGLPLPTQKLGLPIGQHIQLCAAINGELLVRSYTPISNSEQELGHFDLLVKIYRAHAHPSFPEGGQMSQHLERLALGSSIQVKGPTGHVTYQGCGRFVIGKTPCTVKSINLIAGGTGITPCWQIIQAVTSNPADGTQVRLLSANQDEDDVLLKKQLDDLASAHPQFTTHYTLSRPSSSWPYSRGYITQAMLQQHLTPAGTDVLVFLCGPPSMVQQTCLPALRQLGFSKEQLIVF